MKWTSTVSFLGKTFHWNFQVFKTPSCRTGGMSARIPGTASFCIFLDFDNIRDEVLKGELTDLQELFQLGDFHIIATNKFGRHAICVDRMSMREVLAVISESTCDYHFKQGIHVNEYRSWVLRVLAKGNRPKPQYCYSLESQYNGQNLQSSAHATFLQVYYKAPVRLVNPDGNYELGIQSYMTASHLDARKLGEMDMPKILGEAK